MQAASCASTPPTHKRRRESTPDSAGVSTPPELRQSDAEAPNTATAPVPAAAAGVDALITTDCKTLLKVVRKSQASMVIQLKSLQGDHEKLETAIERYKAATKRLEEMDAAHAGYESKRTTLHADAAQIDALYKKNCAAKQIPAA